MLTINKALQIKPQYILSVNYNAGSIGEMVGEDRDLNLYLAEMTTQYNSLVNNACLAFTVECLVSVNDDKVVIEQMNTCPDMQAVCANSIESLPNGSHQVWAYDTDEKLHTVLLDLIESQPIDDIPTHYTIEAY